MIEVSVPIELLSTELIIELYRLGKTASDPNTVLSLILGIEDPNLASRMEAAQPIRS